MYQGHCVSDLPHFEDNSQKEIDKPICKSDIEVPTTQDRSVSKHLSDCKETEPANYPYNKSIQNLDHSKLETKYSYLYSSSSSPTTTDSLQFPSDSSLRGLYVTNNSLDDTWTGLCNKVFV